MTEIVKNNSSIKLDILDMGNVGSDQSESEGVFNSLFGGIDANDNAEVQYTKININDIILKGLKFLVLKTLTDCASAL